MSFILPDTAEEIAEEIASDVHFNNETKKNAWIVFKTYVGLASDVAGPLWNKLKTEGRHGIFQEAALLLAKRVPWSQYRGAPETRGEGQVTPRRLRRRAAYKNQPSPTPVAQALPLDRVSSLALQTPAPGYSPEFLLSSSPSGPAAGSSSGPFAGEGHRDPHCPPTYPQPIQSPVYSDPFANHHPPSLPSMLPHTLVLQDSGYQDGAYTLEDWNDTWARQGAIDTDTTGFAQAHTYYHASQNPSLGFEWPN